MDKKATAVWQGGLKDGKGTISTESKALSDTPYSFRTRFEGTPERIETQATVTLEKQPAGFEITRVHLEVSVRAAGADRAKFDAAAADAKANCPLSKVLKAEISMTARLEA